MHGPRCPFRPRAAAPPPLPRQNPNPYVYFQASVPFYRNPFHLFPNPNLSSTHLPQNPFIQNPGFHPPPFPQIRPTPPNNREETLEKIKRAVGKVNRDLLAAGEGISAYKVSQSALLVLKADSFGSLGFQLQEIPSLYRLIAIESKVNAFINCFVGVRMITSLHDLDIAICKNQGVDRFEDLGMGPLLRNPLVEHYFSVPKDATEIFKISSEDIISSLIDYMHICPGPEIRVEDFLNFIAKQKSVAVRERLGIQIRSLGMHITFIREAKKAEKLTFKRHLRAFKHTSDSIVSEKQVLDGRFNSISECMKLFSFIHEGKHIRFESSSSEDDNEHDVDYREDGGNDNDSKGWCLNSSQNKNNNDQRLSSCPYPSASEEMLRLGLKIDMDGQASPASVGLKESEGRKSSGKKRKVEYQGSNPSIYKLQKTEKEKESVQVLHTVVRNPSEVSKDKSQPGDTGNDDQEDSYDLKLTSDDIGKFITMWKETCREHTVGEVFDKMLKFYKLTKGSRKLKLIFSSYPGIGLLNIAVTAIKRGMWDSLYDTFQAIGEIGSDDPSSTPYMEIMDVGPSSKRGSVSSNSEDIPILSQSQCLSLLMIIGNTLYVMRDSDYHSIFLELSRFFLKGSAELHFANFIHMIVTMAELGSPEEHTEYFIVSSQKVPKLPDEEPVWTLSDVSHVHEEETFLPVHSLPTEQNSMKPKRKPEISSSWPPTDWKSAPDFHFAHVNRFKTKQRGAPSETAPKEYNDSEGSTRTDDSLVPADISVNWVLHDDSLDLTASASQDLATEKSEPSIAGGWDTSDRQASSSSHHLRKPPASIGFLNPRAGSTLSRDQVCSSMRTEQAFITGRLGELLAYKYFIEKYGLAAVTWVNEEAETGLPYDIVIGEQDENKEYIEVKATKSTKKDWFLISTREWQFASERGNSFSIAHVILADEKNAKVTVFNNPLRLCQRGLLHLVVLMSGEQNAVTT